MRPVKMDITLARTKSGRPLTNSTKTFVDPIVGAAAHEPGHASGTAEQVFETQCAFKATRTYQARQKLLFGPGRKFCGKMHKLKIIQG